MSTPSTVNPFNVKEVLRSPQISREPRSASSELTDNPGFRAAEAFIRPSPIATVGDVVHYGFDLRNCTFTLSLLADAPTKEDVPTEIYLPDYHFPPEEVAIEVSGGRWRIDVVDVDGQGMQMLRWWHGEGEQSITVRGVKRKAGAASEDSDGDLGYYETMRMLAANCSVM